MTGECPLVARAETLGIQLQAVGSGDQRHQQAFGLLAQVGFQAAAQPRFEQPQAGLQQNQPDHQQGGDQAQAETALQGVHSRVPKR